MIAQVAPMIGYIMSLGKVLNDLKIEHASIIPITPIAYGKHGWA